MTTHTTPAKTDAVNVPVDNRPDPLEDPEGSYIVGFDNDGERVRMPMADYADWERKQERARRK